MRKAAAVLLCAALSAGSATAGWLSPEERAAFRAELRAYLLEHPEVIEEALSGAEARRQARLAADDLALLDIHADTLFHARGDWTGGNPAGDVTLVSFVDYAAADGASALAAVRALAAADKNLRLVVKDAPAPDVPASERAARFAQAALRLGGPDIYVRAQTALFAAPDLAPATLDSLARDLGLDPRAVRTEMDTPAIDRALAVTQDLVQALDLGPAPAHVIDRTMVRGALPEVALARIVETMRRKK